MFSNVGWGEVFVLALIILIVVGPERLPGVARDIKAALIAARNAIDNTKKQLSEDIGPEFEDIARPMQQLGRLTAMGPKAALTQALFDGDGSYLDAFDPKTIMSGDTQGEAYRKGRSVSAPSPLSSAQPAGSQYRVSPPTPPAEPLPPVSPRPDASASAARPAEGSRPGEVYETRGSFSWDDIT